MYRSVRESNFCASDNRNLRPPVCLFLRSCEPLLCDRRFDRYHSRKSACMESRFSNRKQQQQRRHRQCSSKHTGRHRHGHKKPIGLRIPKASEKKNPPPRGVGRRPGTPVRTMSILPLPFVRGGVDRMAASATSTMAPLGTVTDKLARRSTPSVEGVCFEKTCFSFAKARLSSRSFFI